MRCIKVNNMENDKEIEELEKAAHYWKDKDPVKYKKKLAELARNRKTIGHKEKATQMVLQAKRRERGGSGTTAGSGGTKGHSKGKMTNDTGSAVKRIQNKEKKTGSKLSLDRKNNMRGYESKNTRLIPQKLNRGAHKADEKKISAWKKKLKKHNLDIEQFMTLLQAKALEKGQDELYNMLKVIDLDLTMDHLETNDQSIK